MTDFTRRRLFRRGGTVAGLAAVAALAVVGSAAASAHSPAALHHASGPRPTIVLVHGAWANGSSWDGVVRRLRADGYTVDVPANPLQALAYDPTYLADFLHSISGPIVLVGHSYGGAVITNAATGDPQVKALVYVDAFAPAQGQSIAQLLAAYPRVVRRAREPECGPVPSRPQRRGRRLHQAKCFPRLHGQRPARHAGTCARHHPAANSHDRADSE